MLLAKSNRQDPNFALYDHTERVVSAAKKIRTLWPFLPESLITAAWFHDFGKAASGFQNALKPDGEAWKFRHEVLSAAIFKRCFDLSDEELRLAYFALLTHHKNLGTRFKIGNDFRACEGGEESRWPRKWQEMQVEELRQTFPTLLSSWVYDPNEESPADEVGSYLRHIKPVFDNLLFAQMRGALVAADHLASSGAGTTIAGENITADALQSYVSKLPHWQDWSVMQVTAASTKGNAILLAPTGAGKTEAALRWALANRKGGERIFYVLPYQVSINAMAERLCKVFPDINVEQEKQTSLDYNQNVTILHSNTDLAYLRDAMSDDAQVQAMLQANAKTRANTARKIYSPIKVTTVYQLLNHFFGRKFFEVGFLEMTGAVVIFDEIHAYDGHTLGLIQVLLRSLQKLGARIFIITATLPDKLKEQIMDAAGISKDHEIVLDATDELRMEKRRVVEAHNVNIEMFTKDIRQSVKDGRRTAVVCNTVDKAVALYEILEDLKPFLVHSRFTLGDRAQRETKENIGLMPLVIATQVIEVSLDVSFDIMFTELAPADDLLQRFGRVNRHGKPDPNNPSRCVIACAHDKGSERIYTQKLLHKTLESLHNVQPVLNFNTACQWLEAVYEGGLVSDEQKRMQKAENLFKDVVADLRPMLDPVANVDLEMTLFDSVQVVPVEYEEEWTNHKNRKEHAEAKKLVVSVNGKVWKGVKSDYGQNAYVEVGKQKQIVACFRYDPKIGLDFQVHRPRSAKFAIVSDDDAQIGDD